MLQSYKPWGRETGGGAPRVTFKSNCTIVQIKLHNTVTLHRSTCIMHAVYTEWHEADKKTKVSV